MPTAAPPRRRAATFAIQAPPPIPHEEMMGLFALRVPRYVGTPGAYAAWLEARNRVVASFLPLAMAEALKVRRRIDPEDAMQGAVLGLIRAAEKFDPARGVKFITYAAWWARQGAGRTADDDGRLVHVPAHVQDLVRRVRRGGDPGVGPAGRGWPPGAMAAAEAAMGLGPSGSPVPLHLAPDGQVPALPDDGAAREAAEDAAAAAVRVRAAMRRLAPIEAQVVRLCHGLEDGRRRSQLEVGRALGISQQRVHSIVTVALRRLRASLGVPVAPARPRRAPERVGSERRESA